MADQAPITLTITVHKGPRGYASIVTNHRNTRVFVSSAYNVLEEIGRTEEHARALAIDVAHEWALQQKHTTIVLPEPEPQTPAVAKTDGLARDHWAPNLAADQPGAISGPEAAGHPPGYPAERTDNPTPAMQEAFDQADAEADAPRIDTDLAPVVVPGHFDDDEPDAELDPASQAELAESQETSDPEQ